MTAADELRLSIRALQKESRDILALAKKPGNEGRAYEILNARSLGVDDAIVILQDRARRIRMRGAKR